MSEVVTKPSSVDIEGAVAEFDRENKVIEGALQTLFAAYPSNTNPVHVLLKVTALNTLYSTQIPLYSSRVPTILDVVTHIVSLGIDSRLSRGDDGVVRDIAAVEVATKSPRFYYSFATKYCSWQNRDSYPIFDSRVLHYLCYLMVHNCLDRLRQAEFWDYTRFRGVVQGFRAKYDLEKFRLVAQRASACENLALGIWVSFL
ncbi:MAG TPA: hypothetical protein VKR52_18090 [Terracidiphilus sp.]|nr:hypothetical protein [Terracidiphilus sp.]